jgi:multiple sugar transport system permease protein
LISTPLTLLIAGMAVYGLTRFRPSIPWRSISLGVVLAVLATAALFFSAYPLASLGVLAIVAVVALTTRFVLRGSVMGENGILIAILATRLLPPAVVVLPIYLMAQYSGTLDTRFGLILVYAAANLPVAVWLLHRVFGGAATEQEEAAQLDGASHLRILSEIFAPMVAASVAAVGLLIFILCWNEYLFAAYLASDHAMTLPPWVVGQMSVKEAQTGGDTEEWSRLSAAMVVMLIPLLAGVVVAQRFLSRMTLRGR